MKRLLIPSWAIILLLVTACVPAAGSAAGQAHPTGQANPGHVSQQATPLPTPPAPLVQQPLPKGLLNSSYPVMDWVFNRTCSLAVTSYQQNQMDATIAYDSAAWLYPSDGHLVEGSQDCDHTALLRQARTLGLPTLLTVGVDSFWSAQELAHYIDQASSQPQVPCTAQAPSSICTIVNWAVRGGYSGVIIDFEIVQGEYPGIRQKFAAFLHKLQDALHQQGKLCGVALIHKVGDSPGSDPSFPLNSFQDWALLRGLDFLVDMVLDFDLPLKQPGPLVSIPWLDKQLAYLSRTAPDMASKIIWELPLYGREWRQEANGTWSAINDATCSEAMTLKATHSLLADVSADPTTPEIAWDDQNGSRHELWYNTPSSLLALMTHLQHQLRNLLNDPTYQLPVSFWYRGAECANFFGAGHALKGFYNREAART